MVSSSHQGAEAIKILLASASSDIHTICPSRESHDWTMDERWDYSNLLGCPYHLMEIYKLYNYHCLVND